MSQVISGRLFEKGTDNPVGGIAIELFNKEGDVIDGTPRVVTGEDGSFHIGGLKEGDYILQTAGPPHWSMEWAIEPKCINVSWCQTVNNVDLDAVKCGIIVLKMTDESGEPVAGYPLAVESADSTESFPIKRGDASGDDGILEMPVFPGEYDLSPLYYLDLTIMCGLDSDSYDSSSINVKEGERVTRNIPCSCEEACVTGHLKGIAVDSAGEPVAGAFITLAQDEPVYPIITDSRGQFFIPHYMDSLNDEDNSTSRKKHVQDLIVAQCPHRNLAGTAEVDIRKGLVDGIKVVLTKGATITGKVLTSDGKPLTEGEIAVYPVFRDKIECMLAVGKIAFRGNGSYEAESIPAGMTCDVCVKAPGYGYAYIRVEIPKTADKPVTAKAVTLPRQDKSVSGAVLDLDDKPIAGAKIHVVQEGQERKDWMEWEEYADYVNGEMDIVSGRDGKFKIANLIAGKVTMEVTVSGYKTKEVTVNAGDTDVEIVLEEGFSDSDYDDDDTPIDAEDF